MNEPGQPTSGRGRALARALAAVLLIDALLLVVAPLAAREQHVDLRSAAIAREGDAFAATFTPFSLERIGEDARLLEDQKPIPCEVWAKRIVRFRPTGDPATNGRRYELVFAPPATNLLGSPLLIASFIITVALALATASAGVALVGPSSRARAGAFAFSLALVLAVGWGREWNAVTLFPDSSSYLINELPTRPPLYPLFIDAFDREPAAPRARLATAGFERREDASQRFVNVVRVQRALLIAAVALLAFVVARRVGVVPTAGLAWLAIVLDLLRPGDASAAYNVGSLLSEGLDHALVISLAAALFAYATAPRRSLAAAIGVLLGLALTLRSSNAALVASVALVVLAHRTWREGLARGALVLGLFAATILPACASNARGAGRWRLDCWSGPMAISATIQLVEPGDEAAFDDPDERELVRLFASSPLRIAEYRGIVDGEYQVNRNQYAIAFPSFERVYGGRDADVVGHAWRTDDVFRAVSRKLILRHPAAYARFVLVNLRALAGARLALAALAGVVALLLRRRGPLLLAAGFTALLPLIAIAPACLINYPIDRYRAPLGFAEDLALPLALLAWIATKRGGGRSDPYHGAMAEKTIEARPQKEWAEQWSILERDEDQPPEVFLEWIHPNTVDLFKGKRVLDAGCGGGHLAAYFAQFASEVVALDLNTPEVAKRRLDRFPNVKVVEGDVLTVGPDELGGLFDVAYSIGVLHHTPSPDQGFANLCRLVKPGGRVIAWVYASEGNALVRWLVEPARKIFLRWLPRPVVFWIAWAITIPFLAAMHTVYRLPLRFLPFWEYMERHRRMTVRKTVGDIFDKLNAPHTDFIARARLEKWLAREDLTDVHISPHVGVSWRASATKR